MLAKLLTHALFGIEARPVDVEVDISPAAMPKTILVGLAEAAVKESTHRIERALVNSGYHRPIDRVVINLSPADFPKEAPSFDLPIALGILAASGQLQSDRFADYAVVGELALDGTVRRVKGTLSMALQARQDGRRGIVVPVENGREAAVVEGLEVIAVGSLAEAVGHFSGMVDIHPVAFSWSDATQEYGGYLVDFSDVKGQEMAKRAVTVAAAGRHHLLMLGSPGTGKTLLAQRIGTILPDLSPEESLDTTRIYSAVGQLPDDAPLMLRRPFRSPHHTISDAGLVGGGSTPRPGEISLANNGILFLDELPEFNRRTLEVLRQPLEDQTVTISRALGTVRFPASFMMIAAMNPCPCGFRGDPKRQCNCTPMQIERYLAKISGPLLDRIDIHVEVPPVPFHELASRQAGTNSASMRSQVQAARERQFERFGKSGKDFNGTMSPRQLRQHCQLQPDAAQLLRAAMEEMGLSARAHDKILRVSRTIADLEGATDIAVSHLSEAINYRTLDRNYWSS
ncbi:MAG: YifB family Mg chelatase-like AAA ATPase [Planctomycetaceae bacterium]|nr:YifB family Mg chelatase-like AAA ATPase [Planctomycetaceae bacterium]MCA9043093.1 YifB family Mg chelatase-like AAA ATPase [Planctomycetaceae bacterium]MCB9949362.1 YifB family Mg chelatase-like AAA ATPase [Planctomycetaceae bacterium]